MKRFVQIALKPAVAAVLLTGTYLHTSRLVFGPDLVLQHLLTRTFDMVFAIPMTLAMVLLWAGLRHVSFAGKLAKGIYISIAVYFTISVPLHVRTMLAGNVEQFKVFPGWYSLVILPVLVSMLAFISRLQFRDSHQTSR